MLAPGKPVHLRRRRFDALAAVVFLADPLPSPVESMLAADDLQFILALLAKRKPDQRDLVELRLAGPNDAEIARVLRRRRNAAPVAGKNCAR